MIGTLTAPSLARIGPLAVLVAVIGLSGCATTPDNAEMSEVDPFEYQLNRPVYNFNDALDRNVLAPVARGYEWITPGFARTGVTNFFDNVGYLNTVTNSLLQGKPRRTASDLGRFVINSTIGLLGLVDVASAMGLTEHQEDFGQTLGVWGVDSGPYLMVPAAGPSTARDIWSLPVATVTNVLFLASASVSIPLSALDIVNTRAQLEDAIALRDESAVDPYLFVREAYLQRREYLVYDGNPPLLDYDDAFDDFDDFDDLDDLDDTDPMRDGADGGNSATETVP